MGNDDPKDVGDYEAVYELLPWLRPEGEGKDATSLECPGNSIGLRAEQLVAARSPLTVRKALTSAEQRTGGVASIPTIPSDGDEVRVSASILPGLSQSRRSCVPRGVAELVLAFPAQGPGGGSSALASHGVWTSEDER